MADDLLQRKYTLRFHQLDASGDGVLSRADLAALAQRVIATAGEAPTSAKAEAVRRADDGYWQAVAALAGVGEDGRISLEQFVDALSAANDQHRLMDFAAPAITAHAALADRNGDGVVDLQEYRSVYTGLGADDATIEASFRQLDVNGDGVVTLDEWLASATDFYTSTDPHAPGNLILGQF
ncbi:EF-hand domain-containing protein [Streptomyces sp. NPDC021093]|uniref:EF-hand domain-containing protein n=1 Tax=Streptomyces sp. NPDC021093 TaxID=3365112 RepID=UPI00378F6049